MPPTIMQEPTMTQPQMTQSLMKPAPNAAMLVSESPLREHQEPGGGRKVSRATLGPGSTITAADGTTLFVKDWQGDARNDRPAVFLASLGLPSDMWDNQMLFLNLKGHRCVAYDRRGHGRSSVPAGGYDYDNLADDLHAVLEALDVRDALLVGHSMASGEQVRYLTRHGSARVRQLVFVAPYATPSCLKTAGNADGVTREELDYFLNQVILGDYQRWIEDNKAPFFVEDTPATSRDWIIQMMLKTSLKATYECTRAMGAADFTAEMAHITVPALVIHGDKDASAPLERGRRTAAALVNSELRIYEDAPHGLFITHRERLNADLLDFIAA
jgi:non-heme chloroperoxidase